MIGKQLASRGTPQLNAQTVYWPAGDEFSQTVCLVKNPATQCSNCLLADWRRIFAVCLVKDPGIRCSNCLLADGRLIFANSLSRERPRDSMIKLFDWQQATSFRKQFVSWRTPQFNAETVCWPTGDEFSQSLSREGPRNSM